MRLAAVFSNHMVLQRDKEVRIFGELEADAAVTVTIDDIRVTEKACAGSFLITLPPHKAGGPYTLTLTAEDETVTVEDVMYGEVWLMNGQSNIELELQNARGGMDIIKKTENPMIRFYNVPKCAREWDAVIAEKEQTWRVIQRDEFKDISAVGYYLADVLCKELGVPIGIVDCYQGGTSITCWYPEELLSSMPEGKPYLESYRAVCEGRTEEEYQAEIDDYDTRVAAWCEKETDAKKKDPELMGHALEEVIGAFPWPPPMGERSAWRPCGVYYSMLLRIVPYTFRGIVYYQGEEDAPRHSLYKSLLKTMIRHYREIFLDKELPFVDVQLPMWLEHPAEENREWGRQRLMQQQAVDETEHAYLTTLIDCGELDNIHPVDKKTPGERLAKNILAEIYHSPGGTAAMELSDAVRSGSRVLLSFRNTGGRIQTLENELVNYRGETEEQGHLYGFEASADGEHWFVPKSRIEGERIVLECPAEVRMVSYGYFNYGKVNVYSAAGEPLAPFLFTLADSGQRKKRP